MLIRECQRTCLLLTIVQGFLCFGYSWMGWKIPLQPRQLSTWKNRLPYHPTRQVSRSKEVNSELASTTAQYDAPPVVDRSCIKSIRKTHSSPSALDIDDASSVHGMPWKSSIDPSYNHSSLFFMPFWEWQLDFMKQNLQNLRLLPTSDRSGSQDLTVVENKSKHKRMITLCFTSDEYRLIRMTLVDGGTATQVFTSLWYPHDNLPLLGIDFLQFSNQTRHLTIVDFQPVQETEQEHDLAYEHLMEPVRDLYPSLHHQMSDRFYDETQFFSKKMLYGKGDQTDYVWRDLLPAYKSYVDIHHELVCTAMVQKMRTPVETVLERQKEYDLYSSVRDPAHALLKSFFGKEYADSFIYDVLFPLSNGVNAA